MLVEYFATLFEYHHWANQRILSTARPLDDGQLNAMPLAGLGSLRAILVHSISAEWMWRCRWQGHSPAAMLSEADFTTLAAIGERWSAEEQQLRAFVESQSEAELQRVVVYRTTSGKENATPLWQLLAHLINHSTQHRSEAAAILTAIGYSPGDLDLISFLRERDSQ